MWMNQPSGNFLCNWMSCFSGVSFIAQAHAEKQWQKFLPGKLRYAQHRSDVRIKKCVWDLRLHTISKTFTHRASLNLLRKPSSTYLRAESLLRSQNWLGHYSVKSIHHLLLTRRSGVV